MKDRTITLEPNTSGIRSGLKNELAGPETGVKITGKKGNISAQIH